MTNENITPFEYFDKLKKSKTLTSTQNTKKLKDIALKMLYKAATLNQRSLARKLKFIIQCYEREEKVLNAGYNQYLRKEDVLKFLDIVSEIDKDVIKIISLEQFPREIPDDISEKIKKLKDNKIFDDYYILFTDYTGKVEKEVEKQRKIERDPVIFGIFLNNKSRFKSIDDVFDRLYYIADWTDEYCDITLSTILDKLSITTDKIVIPQTNEEINKFINELDDNTPENRLNDFDISSVSIAPREEIKKRKSLLSKIKSIFKKKK